jgi:biopolymer transport protein ExbD
VDKGVRYGNVMEILGRIGNAGDGRISLLSQPKTGTETVSK